MKKRIIILISFIFLLCGCSAETTLTVSDDTIFEDVSVKYYEDNEISKSQIKGMFRKYQPVYKDVELYDEEPDIKKDGIDYYDFSLKDIGAGYNAKYSYSYPIGRYVKARGASKAFKSLNVIRNYDKGTITISTDNSGCKLFNIFADLESFTLNIKSNNEVVEANVEPVNGVYTWNYSQSNNSQNVYIVLKMDNFKEKEETPDQQDQQFYKDYGIFIAIGAIVVFLVGVKIITKMSRINYE